MEPRSAEYFCAQVLQKDVSGRLQAGEELLLFLGAPGAIPDLEDDPSRLAKTVDALTGWVGSSNYRVSLLGLEILSAFVDRLSTRFKSYVAMVTTALIDRMGDTKDRVRDEAQNLTLKLMDEVAPPMYIWEQLASGFKHKNFRSREGVCLCLIETLNIFGAQPLVISKLVPHLCILFGDSNSQVRNAAISAVVEIYRHVGEKLRSDLCKRDIPPARLEMILAKFDEVQNSGGMILSVCKDKSFDDEESVDGNRPSSAASAFKVPAPKTSGNPVNSGRKPGSAGGPKVGGASKEGGAGAVDEDDFIKAFTDVPSVQIYSSRELEETLNKIREILSDDKHDWDQRANALKKIRSLLVAGAAQYDCFFQHLRLLDGALKLSAKDLRSQVVREACITVAHLSTVLGNKFDHGAEAIVPTLFNLVPNSAKVMATSGCAAIRFIIRHTHVPRLIPLITSNCTSKSVPVRRRSFEFLDLLLQEWQTHSLERHAAVLVETIKKGIHDADAEARVEARKTYMGLRNHFPGEAETLYNSLEPSYQKSLQTYLKSSGSVASLPQSDRSSSSSQESLNRPFSSKWSTANPSTVAGRVSVGGSKTSSLPGSLQRSRSDIDVNAAAGAKAHHAAGQAVRSGRLGAGALNPGSYASLGRVRAKLSTPLAAVGNAKTDSRGRSRTKMVSQSQPGSRSGSPGRVLTTTALSTVSSGAQRVLVNSASAQKRSKIPRSQGCSREASPSRLSVARSSRIPRPSVSQGCSREASRESSRDTSPVRSFQPLGPGYGISQSSRLSSSVSAMRVLNTGSDVEEAVADALKKPARRRYESYGMHSDDDANSDASSACSERSYSSRNGSIPTYMRQTEDVAEVLNRCASSNWSERKEGLLGLQNLLKNQRTLSRVELKRLCEIFTRMFADPHGKRVFSMFLETLVDFIQVHKDDLQDWLFVLLTQLLKKMGADLLGSVQAKVQKALDVTRESFPNDLQFNILMRFTVDQTQTPSLKVKVAILKYIETLAKQMDPGDFINSSETRLAVSRVITWTTEPKSSDVRKAAQSVLISLFELNTPEFTMLLGALPKTFQDGATKLLHNHLRNTGNGTQSSMGSPLTRPTPRSPANWSSPLTSPTNTSQNTLSPSAFDYDTENMNSEDIYSSLRGVTEAIQNFSFRSQEDMSEPLKREPKKEDADTVVPQVMPRAVFDLDCRKDACRVPVSQHGIQLLDRCGISGDNNFEICGPGMSDPRAGGDATDSSQTALDNKASLLHSAPLHSSSRSRDYNPYNYSDSISPFNKSALKEAMFDDDADQFPDDLSLDHSDLVAELLKELSNHNERIEERKFALYELMKLTQEESFSVWDEHFKTILLLLLETLGDKEPTIRALALKVLKEILRHQPARFKNYAELTVMKTLEAHKDPHKEVVRSAEEAASVLATSISPEQCIKVLCPIIQTADYPINLAAIKMQTKVIERVSKETLNMLLPEIMPGLIQGYDNSESSVRKACVFCLVAVHAVIGDELKPHLSQLTGSKMKLLNLYIKRAQTGSAGADPTTDVSGQS
ncbi:CLIP-associating protein 2 isoform X1 [Arvicola amphibius]|uniref:CLIP-associating protein 2 isoform X1 n=1 Tax=Arvicola amphibius TaxID=1047088 RepID=UPI0018E32B60|nr:CLIP-associating protein 2 isoform X1 [Arvicola amphibius]